MKNKANVLYALLAVAFIIAAYNQLALMSLTGAVTAQAQPVKTNQEPTYSSIDLQKAIDVVIPKGVPDVYGTALGVDYDEPVDALNTMAALDGDLYEDGKIKFSDMSSSQKERYMNMGTSIACEFCCGATTLIQRDGQPACGCAHSAAMRGLMKYLLINTNMTNDQIMAEVIKVKSISFPQEMVGRYMQQNGMLQASGSNLNSLPQQVGGC